MMINRIDADTPTWFGFPVTRETEIYHDKGNKARWRIALDSQGSPVVCDEWRVFYGIDYNKRTRYSPDIAWDFAPPLYVQAAVYRMLVAEKKVGAR